MFRIILALLMTYTVNSSDGKDQTYTYLGGDKCLDDDTNERFRVYSSYPDSECQNWGKEEDEFPVSLIIFAVEIVLSAGIIEVCCVPPI